MPAKITIRNNGPVRIEGEFTVVDQDGKPFDLGGQVPGLDVGHRASVAQPGQGSSSSRWTADSSADGGTRSSTVSRVVGSPLPSSL